MSEIKLRERYPLSRPEDVTDAYMRGFQASITIMCDPLRAENDALRKELEIERDDNASIRALFDAIAPRCGKPDCPSLVEYVEQLREMVRDMWSWLLVPTVGGATLHDLQGRMRELGIEVTS